MKETVLAIDICSSKIATIIANIQDKNVDILGISISNSFGIKNAEQKWTMPIRNWSLTLSQLAIHFEGRLDDSLNL